MSDVDNDDGFLIINNVDDQHNDRGHPIIIINNVQNNQHDVERQLRNPLPRRNDDSQWTLVRRKKIPNTSVRKFCLVFSSNFNDVE